MPTNTIARITTQRLYKFLSDHGAEVNYIVGTFLNDMTNRVKKNDTLMQLDETSRVSVVVGWNYLDGLYNLMQAIKLIADKNNYRYNENRFKAAINLFCGIQLYIFSYNPTLTNALDLADAASLAGISFFIAMVVDFISASIDYKHIHKETSFKGWLDEKLKTYYHGLKNDQNVSKLARDIRARCRVYVANHLDEKKSLKAYITDNLPEDLEKGVASNLLRNLGCKSAEHKLRDQELALELHLINRHYRTQLVIKAASMIGMGCLAITGFISDKTSNSYVISMVIGLALTNVVASWYTIKNSERASDAAEKNLRFFSRSNCCEQREQNRQFELRYN